MSLTPISRLAIAILVCGASVPMHADVDFRRDIQPLFRQHCTRCHGPTNEEGGLRLTQRAAAFSTGDSGEEAIVPGDPEASLLLKRLTNEDYGDLMPLDGEPLSGREIALIRQWIEAGAVWPDDAEQDRHWAYVKPVRPTIPAIHNQRWPVNEIDVFILARLDSEGRTPSAIAERAKLLRRVSLALIGLPPTIEEINAFVSDTSPHAYERCVDRLLASPHYGERWAQPWLDLARYADSNGFQADQLRESWPYRDWVIDALNQDMPFDQFVTEQLAGDLLPDATVEQRIATGFHRTVTCNVEAGVHPEENRVNQVFDRINTTGTVFLGTSLECCQCHEHKYDPFTQEEYYRLFAFFNNTPLEVEQTAGVTWDFVGPKMSLPLPDQTQRLRDEMQDRLKRCRADRAEAWKRAADQRKSWEDELRAKIADQPKDIAAILQKKKPTKKDEQRLDDLFSQSIPEIRQFDAEIQSLTKQIRETEPTTTLVMVERDEPRETHVMIRGNYLDPGERVACGTPAALHAMDPALPRNRLGFAQWMVSPDNPLLARVTVNRWWAEFFGRGIVSTPEDFGSQSEPPTHPDLLDWLAVEFMESGWSMKHIHKRIVMSATYRQSSRVDEELLRQDPANALYARGPRFRLPAEMIRDNSLAISGLLDTAMGGPPVMPYQPPGIWRAVGRNAPKWNEANDGARFRRGVYVVWRRAAPYPSFVNFDAPDRASCIVQRACTNTPLQALTLLNDPAYVETALALAQRMCALGKECSPAQRVEYGFRLCVARRPQAEETAALVAMFQEEQSRFRADPDAAETLLENTRSFRPRLETDPLDLAAWFLVANVLLNLDETISSG
jgi:hypothetical protein